MGTSTCTGAIQTQFTWTPATGQTATSDPPPGNVIVMETCSANVGVSGQSYTSPPMVTGACDTGLGVSQNPMTFPTPTGTPYYTTNGANLTCTRYGVKPGASPLTLTCSPLAKASNLTAGTNAAGSSSISVTYTAAVYPITMNMAGATRDSSGNYNILIGQYCSAALVGIPSALLPYTTYNWSVTGTTYQSWIVSANQQSATANPGPGPLNQPTAHWYWDEAANTETVSCTATVTPPVGEGATFTISMTKQVNVWDPYYGVSLIDPGTVGFDFNNPLQPIVTSGADGAGIIIHGEVGTPSAFCANGSGAWAWLQLCDLDREYEDPAGGDTTITGGYDLDSAFPYNLTAGQGDVPGSTNSAIINGNSGTATFSSFTDTPDWPITVDTYSYSIDDHFKLHIMYLPPDGGDGVSWVPLTVMQWGWGGALERNFGSSWPNSSPGSVNFFGHQDLPNYPLWSSVFQSGS